MAVAVVMEFDGGDTGQYDRVIEKMGFEKEGSGAPGGLFHWAAKTDDGMLITDVWESKEQFGQFADEKIGPITQEEGLSEPKLTFYEVHNYLTAG